MSERARGIPTTAFDIAERYVGVTEVRGRIDNPLIMAMLTQDVRWPTNDETPWCSAFANWVAWHLRLSRSKSLRARSWLQVGTPIELEPTAFHGPLVGFDVVILKRGRKQPGPSVINAPGHVGFYAGHSGPNIFLLGGNQGNSVSVAPYAKSRVLGIRRLHDGGTEG